MRKATECLGKLNFNNYMSEQIKDDIYTLLSQFKNDTDGLGIAKMRKIKNEYTDAIYKLLKRKAKK